MLLILRSPMRSSESEAGVSKDEAPVSRARPGHMVRDAAARLLTMRRKVEEQPLHSGSVLDPIRNRSIMCAHWRPSRIAQTTSDWPRRMSPAVNTFASEVW